MYFKNFQNMLYEFNIGGKDTAIFIKDITRNIRFRRDILANITVYDEYDIQEGETPEHIAEKLYGNAQYHWILMLVNERYDYKSDFPLSQYVLEKYINDNYNNPYDIHHYVDSKGYIVDSPNVDINNITQPSYPVSNYDYEYTLNESKRRIKIIPIVYIEKIINEFKKII
jgi:hypothetical protein